MLKLRNFTAGYGKHPVLSDLSLTFPTGKVTALIGPNGSGKSTLLKALAGVLPATGTLSLDAQSLTALSARERAQKIAYLPQNRPVPEIGAERLVLHGRFPYLSYPRRYRAEDYQKANASMEALGIGNLAERSLPTLSGGQRQKVYIAMALAQDTPVILLDEPTTYLDISHQMQLMALARSLADSGKTVVMVLHDLLPALEYADHIAVLQNGQTAAQGTPEEVLRSGCLKEVFGVEVNRIQTAGGWKYYYGV